MQRKALMLRISFKYTSLLLSSRGTISVGGFNVFREEYLKFDEK